MGRGLDGYFLNTFWSCAVFKLHRGGLEKFPVAHSEWETPLPIPNRAVKPLSADGTWGATPWESRSPPVLYCGPRRQLARAADLGKRRAGPRSRGSRSAATPRHALAAPRLLSESLAIAPVVGADRGTQLPQGGCTGSSDAPLASQGAAGGKSLRNPGESSQRALARTRRGLRSRLGGRRRRSAGR